MNPFTPFTRLMPPPSFVALSLPPLPPFTPLYPHLPPFKPYLSLPTPFLPPILNTLHVPLRHTTHINNPLQNLPAIIPLHDNLLGATGRLGHTAPRGKLLPPLLGHFLQIEAVRLKSADGGDVFALVALYALDLDFGGEFGFVGFGFEGEGARFFLGGVFLRAFLRVQGESGEGLIYGCYGVRGLHPHFFPAGERGGARELELRGGFLRGGLSMLELRKTMECCTFRIESLVHIIVCSFKPFLALLCCAAEFAVLRVMRAISLRFIGGKDFSGGSADLVRSDG